MTQNYDQLQPSEAKQWGITLAPGMRFMPCLRNSNGKSTMRVDYNRAARMIMDSANGFGSVGAMTTPINVGFPVQYFNYIDPNVVHVMFSVMNADKLLPMRKLGDFTQDYVTIPVSEEVGEVTSYSDFTTNGRADVNFTYPMRQCFRYQTNIAYGEFEMARAAAARVQLVAEKQQAAATAMAKAENAIYLYGVEGVALYGLLNDPNLDSPISPESVQVNGEAKTTWVDKAKDKLEGANHIYRDIMALYADLQEKTGGLVDSNTHLILALSPNRAYLLTNTNVYNVNVEDLLKRSLPNVEFVSVPELSLEEGERMYMIATDIAGQSVGFNAFSEKLRASPVDNHATWWQQKFSAASFGCVITQPSLISCMSGI